MPSTDPLGRAQKRVPRPIDPDAAPVAPKPADKPEPPVRVRVVDDGPGGLVTFGYVMLSFIILFSVGGLVNSTEIGRSAAAICFTVAVAALTICGRR